MSIKLFTTSFLIIIIIIGLASAGMMYECFTSSNAVASER